MNKEALIKYWVDSSEIDFEAMLSMFRTKHYNWALFIGHLVIEKLLKAIFVKVYGKNVSVPKIHNLVLLANKSNMQLTAEQKDILREITSFNINARYLDYKLNFYKKCTLKYANEQKNKIKKMKLWLKKQI